MVDITKAVAYLKKGSIPRTRSQDDEGQVLVADLCARHFSDEAAIFYLVDEGDSYHMITHRDLEEAGISDDHLHELALENLKTEANNNFQLRRGADDVFIFTGSSDFIASAILLDRFWDERHPDGVAVAIPARDVLAFCAADNEAGIAGLVKACDAITANDPSHPISRNLHVRKNGEWEVIPRSPSTGTSVDMGLAAFEQDHPVNPATTARRVDADVMLQNQDVTHRYSITFEYLDFVGVHNNFVLFKYHAVMASNTAAPTIEDLSDEQAVFINQLLSSARPVEFFTDDADLWRIALEVTSGSEGFALAISDYEIHAYHLQ